jgi:predicted TIM-barrel fold metal-dependent hydrolase
MSLISADSHVLEPPDLWLNYIDPAFRDSAPVLKHDEDADRWYVGSTFYGDIGHVTQAGQRYEDATQIKLEGRWEGVPVSAYEPGPYLDALAIDGTAAAVIYPTEGLYLYRVPEVPLANAIFQAYNRWIADFCRHDPLRLVGVAMLTLEDIDFAVKEVERIGKDGLKVAMIPVYPAAGQPYSDRRYEPFWKAAADAGLILSMHAATNRPGSSELDNDLKSVTPATRTTLDYWVRHSLAEIMFAGVFERYPTIKIVSVENEIGWIPHFIKQMEFVYAERQYLTPVRFSGNRTPRDVWRSNVLATFLEDDVGISMRGYIGTETLMWGSDFPHSESTWPNSRQVLDKILEGVSPSEKVDMVFGNATRVFGFSDFVTAPE